MWSLMWCVCDWWLLSVISCLCQLRPAADSWAAAAAVMMMVMMVVVVVMCSRLWWGRWWDVMVSSQSRSLWCLSTAPSVHSSVSSCSSSSLTSLCQLSSPHRVHTHTPLHFTPLHSSSVCLCHISLYVCVTRGVISATSMTCIQLLKLINKIYLLTYCSEIVAMGY